MSRILHHVGRDDFKKTRQRQIGEQKERAAQKLKELQEVEKERKQIQEAARPYKSDWRKENLREFGEWVPISSGPANSATTTFGYFAGGEQQINFETGDPITFTYSGLDGIENYPSTITVDQGAGEVHTTNAPPFSQLGVQGYTAKLNPRYKAAQEKYEKELKEWKKKENANLKAIKDTLKSFGTSWEEMRASKKWVKKLGDGTVVAIIPTDSNPSPMNWTNNVRVVKLKQCANASGPMSINYNPPGQYQDWVVENSEIQSEVYLQIGEQPKEPMESQYLMPRRTDFKDVNPQLDASQEFAQKVGADAIMNARVQDAVGTKLVAQDPDAENKRRPQPGYPDYLGEPDLPVTMDLYGDLALLALSAVAVRALGQALSALGPVGLDKARNIIKGAKNWFNKGANTRIPNESQASWRKLSADDFAQRQHISADPNSAWNPVRGMPGYGSAKAKINPRIRGINTKRAAQGKPNLSMDKINPGGFHTGPTPIQRELIKRPIRALMNLFQSYEPNGNLITESKDGLDDLIDAMDKALTEVETIGEFNAILDAVDKAIQSMQKKSNNLE